MSATTSSDEYLTRRFAESINCADTIKPSAVYRLIPMDSRQVIAEVSADPAEVLVDGWMESDVAYAIVTLMGRHVEEFIELRRSKRRAY